MTEAMKENADPALNALEEKNQITVPNHSFPDTSYPWTAKAKKNAVYTFEKDDKKLSVPVHTYLKQEAAKLPPMMQNGKRLVHFDEMWWRFMHGNTRQESVDAVVSYCREVVEIWNKAVEEQNAKTEGHEDVQR